MQVPLPIGPNNQANPSGGGNPCDGPENNINPDTRAPKIPDQQSV